MKLQRAYTWVGQYFDIRSGAPVARVFISYRRGDTAGQTGRLLNDLERRFGRDKFFRDIENLEPGTDFPDALNRALSQCGAMLVMIGPAWASVAGQQGRRLDQKEDFVRIEVATALARKDVLVIPVLVGGASIPREEELPEDLQTLHRRNAIELSDTRWDYDVKRLGDVLAKQLKPLRTNWTKAIAGGITLLALVVFFAVLWISSEPKKTIIVEHNLNADQLEHNLNEFHSYLGRIGFTLKTPSPIIDTKNDIPGGGIGYYDEENNILYFKEENVGDPTLVLSSYATDILRGQAGYTPPQSNSWPAEAPYYAAMFGIAAYLVCSFRNDPYFRYQKVNLSTGLHKVDQVEYAEEGYAAWGSLFWRIRDLLQKEPADKLVVRTWLTVSPPQKPADFPRLFARRMVEIYQSTSGVRKVDQLRALLISHGIEMSPAIHIQ